MESSEEPAELRSVDSGSGCPDTNLDVRRDGQGARPHTSSGTAHSAAELTVSGTLR